MKCYGATQADLYEVKAELESMNATLKSITLIVGELLDEKRAREVRQSGQDERCQF